MTPWVRFATPAAVTSIGTKQLGIFACASRHSCIFEFFSFFLSQCATRLGLPSTQRRFLRSDTSTKSRPFQQAQRYLTRRLVALAKDRGLHISEIDKSIPLEKQGPFHLILHKYHSDKGTPHGVLAEPYRVRQNGRRNWQSIRRRIQKCRSSMPSTASSSCATAKPCSLFFRVGDRDQ